MARASRSTVVVMAGAEGITDAAVARRLIAEVATTADDVQGLKGKDDLLKRLPGFNQAARLSPWLVLMDLDQEECTPGVVKRLLPRPARLMSFRIVVRSIEAWLLADREGIAGFLGVASARIPRDPDQLSNPKQDLVNLARRSSRREIRTGLVPLPKSGRNVGEEYSLRLIEFANDSWRPAVAARTSESLRRCRERLRELVQEKT